MAFILFELLPYHSYGSCLLCRLCICCLWFFCIGKWEWGCTNVQMIAKANFLRERIRVKYSFHRKCQRFAMFWPMCNCYQKWVCVCVSVCVEAVKWKTKSLKENWVGTQHITWVEWMILLCGWQCWLVQYCSKFNATVNTHFEQNTRITRTHVHTISL